MKVGIFGDSYAYSKMDVSSPVWSELLPSKYIVANHGLKGSTLFYSIQQIKKHYKKYDKIILVVTRPGRIEFSSMVPPGEGVIPPIEKRFISGIPVIDHYIKVENSLNNPNKIRLQALETARNYYLYIQNYEFEKCVHWLLVKDIKDFIPDIILINTSVDSSEDGKTYSTNNMDAIFQKENKHWGLQERKGYIDRRNCHMTIENNKIFAEKVEQWLDGQTAFIDTDDFVTPDNKEFYIKEYE